MQAIRQTGWMVVRQLRNISRQPIWVVMMIIQPMIWLVLYGQLFKYVGAQGHAPSAGSYIQFLAPGIICMNAFFGGMWSGMGMITDLDRKVVDRFLAAPASRFAIVLSQVVRAGITAMIQTLILLLVGLALGVRVHGGGARLARHLRRGVPPRGRVRRLLERSRADLPPARVDDRHGEHGRPAADVPLPDPRRPFRRCRAGSRRSPASTP